jgi:hypothetical protein
MDCILRHFQQLMDHASTSTLKIVTSATLVAGAWGEISRKALVLCLVALLNCSDDEAAVEALRSLNILTS